MNRKKILDDFVFAHAIRWYEGALAETDLIDQLTIDDLQRWAGECAQIAEAFPRHGRTFRDLRNSMLSAAAETERELGL